MLDIWWFDLVQVLDRQSQLLCCELMSVKAMSCLEGDPPSLGSYVLATSLFCDVF